MARFAAADGLDDAMRVLARGLASARLDVYRVERAAAGATVGLRSLGSGAGVDVLAGEGLERLGVGDMLVARLTGTTSIATPWGSCARFDGRFERRWRACLAALPGDRQAAGLALLEFHPEDAAEPLPDDRVLDTAILRIEDGELVVEELEGDGALECIGQSADGGWAFAWLGDPGSGRPDLGGWDEGGAIEVARVTVGPRELVIVSGDSDALAAARSHLERSLGDLVSSQLALWAA